MDENRNKFTKIYSRNRLKLPKIQYFLAKKSITGDIKSQKLNSIKARKITKILIILIIAFLVADVIIKAIEPIIDTQCVTMAKSIATKISNEQATIVMADYDYEDLMKVTKDEKGNIKMISSNMITINKIISDIPILIQKELNRIENNRFYIKLGTFTGSKILAGRGPDVEIKMSAIGNIETDLKSEFKEAGINQTLHRIYLEVRCNVVVLTPFNSIEEQIVNQVLLAEGIIVGNIPSTYYSLEGLNKDNAIDVIE